MAGTVLVCEREGDLNKSTGAACSNLFYVLFQTAKGSLRAFNKLDEEFWWGCKDGKRKTCWVA
jgi:hypothetical protein